MSLFEAIQWSARGAFPGDSLEQIQTLWGKPLSFDDKELYTYRESPRLAALVKNGRATTLYSDVVWAGAPFLQRGDSREQVHLMLGAPTDPGKLSSMRPPHYESYDGAGIRLMINFHDDEVTGFVLSARA